MHIADGVASMPVLITGTLLAVGGVAVGLRQITPERMPVAALVSTMLFVASLIHIPIGPVQMHLVLNGLAGLILGWVVFPALLIALLLQAVMFGFGGLTVLGLNTCIMAIPGLFAHLLFQHRLRQPGIQPARSFAIGALTGFIGILLSSILLFVALSVSGEQFKNIAVAIMLAHSPLLLIEALLTGVAVRFLWLVRPEIFGEGAGS